MRPLPTTRPPRITHLQQAGAQHARSNSKNTDSKKLGEQGQAIPHSGGGGNVGGRGRAGQECLQRLPEWVDRRCDRRRGIGRGLAAAGVIRQRQSQAVAAVRLGRLSLLNRCFRNLIPRPLLLPTHQDVPLGDVLPVKMCAVFVLFLCAAYPKLAGGV